MGKTKWTFMQARQQAGTASKEEIRQAREAGYDSRQIDEIKGIRHRWK